MIELLRLHFRFLRQPTTCLDQYVRFWPISLGIAVYCFSLIHHIIMNAQALSVWMRLLSDWLGISDVNLGVILLLLFAGLSFLFQYYIMPIVAARLAPGDASTFDIALYRRLVLYSPFSYVTFSIIVLLPLNVLASGLLSSDTGWVGLAITLLIGALSLWSTVLIIGTVIIHVKGLRLFFDMSTLNIILLVLIIPLIISLPLIIILIIGNYVQVA